MSTFKPGLLVMSPDQVAQSFGYDITREVMNGSGVAQSVTEVRLMVLVALQEPEAHQKTNEILVFDAPLELLANINKDAIDGIDLLIEVARRGLLPDHPYLNVLGPQLVAAADVSDQEAAHEAALKDVLFNEKATFEGIVERVSQATGKNYGLLNHIQAIPSPLGVTIMFSMLDAEMLQRLHSPDRPTDEEVSQVADLILSHSTLPEDMKQRIRDLVMKIMNAQ